jgi:hypothetical protein
VENGCKGARYSEDIGMGRDVVAIMMGLLLGVSLVLLHPGMYMRFSISGAMSCCVLAVNAAIGSLVLLRNRRGWQLGGFGLASMAAVAFGIIVVHDCVSVASISGQARGLLSGLVKVLEFVAICVTGLPWLLLRSERLALASVAIGLATYCGVNLLAYKGLGMTGLTAGGMQESWANIDGVRTDRMIAPFSDGLNNFGIFAALGLTLCMVIVGDRRALREKVLSLALAGGMVTCLYACILVQMRGAAIMCVAAVAWVALGRRAMAIALLWMALVVYVGGAWLYMELYRLGVLDGLVAFLPRFLERTGEQFLALSGRVMIWDYALSLVAGGQIPLLGLGVAVRDTTPAFALSGAAVGDSGMTCHNSFLDLLCVYGPVIAGLIGALTIGIIAGMSRGDVVQVKNGRSVRHGLFGLILWAGTTEAISGSALFWALCWLCVLSPEADHRAGNQP